MFERFVAATLRIAAWIVLLVLAVVLLTTAVVISIAASTYAESLGVPLLAVVITLGCAAIAGTILLAREYQRLRGLHEALAEDDPPSDGDDLGP
jgi:hypothetical protein